MFNDISYINLYNKNSEALIAFYRDIVGIDAKDPNADPKTTKWYGFETEGATLAIEKESSRDKIPFSFNRDNPVPIQFRADSLEELQTMSEHLKSKGVALLAECKEKNYGVITNFLDPDGNLLEILYEPKK